MANEQFSLCWDNFHTNMSSELNSLLKTEDLVDVTLAAEGRYLKAHKMILSVCSPYFRELFHVNPCQHPIVFLKDVSYNVLSNLLEFMYQGEVKVSQDDLGTFIKTAEALKIKGLTGDGHSELQSQVEVESDLTSTPAQKNILTSSESPVTVTRKSVREKTPPRKKLLGPASKRFKTDTEYSQNKPSENQSSEPQQTKEQTLMENNLKHSTELGPLTTFKVEPGYNDTTLANDEDITYDDTTMEDIRMENAGEYLMESTDEVKPGTSTEVANNAGDNQGAGALICTPLYCIRNHGQARPHLLIDNYTFLLDNVKRGRQFWRCTDKRKYSCTARCSANLGIIKLTRAVHSHPPDYEKINHLSVYDYETMLKHYPDML